MERSKIQSLYDACNAIFSKKQLPTYREIQWLRSHLDTIEAIDVGVDAFSLRRCRFSCIQDFGLMDCERLMCANQVSQITYIHIYQSDEFSIGIFCFPAGEKFPLHDHPRMTVLTKVLYGSMYIKSYDWVKCETTTNGKIGGLAGKVADGVLQAPCEASVLFPRSGGNIHSFTALTPSAILDVLSPPYSEELGRPSTYYSEFPIPSLPGYAILEEKEQPQDLVVIGAPYLGPQLDVDADRC